MELHLQRFRFVPVAALIMLCLGFEAGGFQLVLLNVANEFALNTSQMGLLAGLRFFATLGMPLLFGRLSDKIGKKRVLAISLPIYIFGCLITILAVSPVLSIAGILIIGIGFSITDCIVAAAVSDLVLDDSSRTMSLVQAMFSLGAVMGPIVSDLLIRFCGASWRIVFLLAGGGFVLLYPLLLGAELNKVKSEGEKRKVSELLKKPMLLSFCSVNALYTVFGVGALLFIDSFYVLELKEPVLGAYAISAFWLFMSVSRLIFSKVRLDTRRTLIYAISISAALVGLIAAFGNAQLTLILYALTGAAAGPIYPILAGLMLGSSLGDTGTVSSVLATSASLGSAIGPSLMGIVSGLFGLRSGFLVLSALAFSASAATFLSFKKAQQKPASAKGIS